MKKLYLALVAWLCLALAATKAQNDIEQQLLYMLSEVDTGPVRSETGIMTDRVPNYVPIRLYNGKNENDSLYVTRGDFIVSYAIIRNAHVDSMPLFSQDSLLQRLEYYEGKPLLPLGLMTYRYQRIRDNAVEDNLMYYDGEKFRVLIDPVSGLYQTDTLCMMACLQNRYLYGREVPFILPDHFRFGNINVSSVSVDFGEGSGFRVINDTYVHRIIYPAPGLYTLRFQVTLVSGDVLEAQSQLEVSDLSPGQHAHRKGVETGLRNNGYSPNPDGTKHFGSLKPGEKPKYDEYGNQIGIELDYDNLVPGSGAFAHYWLNKNCAEPKIRKPLIIISGFDPGNNYGPDKVINDLNEGLLDEDYDLSKRLKALIHDEDYDIFFINYYNSTIDIRENATYAKQAVEWINAQKKANGSSEKNIILGVSMGGLVSKWMLQEFEMNGQDHEAQLFMTFDSPMRGANIPLALQALPLRLGDRKILGIPLREKKDELKNGVKTVSSKAARQMLYYNLSVSPEFYVSPSELSVEHDAFFAEMDSRGELKVPYIPFSNGAIDGTGQPFNSGELIQELESSIAFSDELQLLIYTEGYSLSSNDMIIHANELSYEYFGAFIYKDEELRITDGFVEWDNAPGGLRTFEDRKNGVIPNENGWLYKSFCFIPTISALDLRGVSDPFQGDLRDFETTISEHAPHIRSYNGSTETSIQFEQEQTNQEHVSLNNKLATFLLGNLKTKDLMLTQLSDRTFNFGAAKISNALPNGTVLSTSMLISNDLHIFNEGKVWINRNDKIAFTDEPNLANTFPKEFEVSLGNTKCEGNPVVVLVDEGGEIRVGDWSVENTGTLTIQDGTTLIIGNGGIVTVESNAKIVVKNGGVLKILDSGTLNVSGDGRIIVENGGVLLVEEDAGIVLETEMLDPVLLDGKIYGSAIELHGTLRAKDGVLRIQGQGFVRILPDHEMKTETGHMKWIGHGTVNPSFRIDTKTEYTFETFEIENAKCMVNKPVKIMNAGEVSIQGSALYSPFIPSTGNLPTDVLITRNNENILELQNILSVVVHDSDFDDMPVHVDDFEVFLSVNSEFTTEYKSKNIRLKKGVKSNFSNCMFKTVKPFFIIPPINPIKKSGIDCSQVFETRISNSQINGFNISNSRYDIPDEESDLIGVRLENSPYLYMTDNTEISHSAFGIFSPDAVNIVMNNSSIKGCKIGIQMTGASDLGMVKMLCSTLENNEVGIKGVDILLAIDGIINSQTTKNGYVTANYFDNIQSHFSICYKNKNLAGFEIPARLNRWVDKNKYALSFCGGPAFMELIQTPENDGMCARVQFSSCEDQSPGFPLTQSGIDANLYTGLCNSATCKGEPIMENYWRGFSCFYNDNLWETSAFFQPLAEEYFVDGNEVLPLSCRSMLKEANTFVSGFNFFRYDSTVSTILEVKPSCRKTGANEYETVLVLHIPEWAKPYNAINWYASEGGVIYEMSPDKLEIITNGTGKYLAAVNGLQCVYSGYYNFDETFQFPFTCPPACLTSVPVLQLDESSCTLYIQNSALEHVLEQANASFILQKFLNGQWVNISGVTSFQVTEDGTYRYVVQIEGCDDMYSNYVVTNCSGQCLCFAETLVYNEENCSLSWSNICEGFSVTLQRQNPDSSWENLGQNVQTPFYIQIDGSYRLVFQKEGCSTSLSNSVITNCALPGSCSCEAPSLQYNAVLCSLNWSQPACAGYTTTLEKQSGGVWSMITNQSPYMIPTNANGNYRLVTRKAGCFPGHSNTVIVQCSCTSPEVVRLYDTGVLGTDLDLEAFIVSTHLIPFSSNVCGSRIIEAIFSKTEVSDNWNIIAEGSMLYIDWNYTDHLAKVYLTLPEEVSAGETRLQFTSPCGDIYTFDLEYSCEAVCPGILVEFAGNTIASCENISLLASGGTSPYSFSIIGEGNMGTLINQQGSEIDLSGLLIAETISLQILVTDANGCTAVDQINYVRCGIGCQGSECLLGPVSCGEVIQSTLSGYNENAIVNFVVEENTDVVNVLLNPFSQPQEYEISKNGDAMVYHSSIAWAPGIMLCEGYNYFPVPDNTNIPTDAGTLIKSSNYAKSSIPVVEGDILTVRISNPNQCSSSSWQLKFECEEGEMMPFLNTNGTNLAESEDSDDAVSVNSFNHYNLKFLVLSNIGVEYPTVVYRSDKEMQGEIYVSNNLGQVLFRKPVLLNQKEIYDPLGMYRELPSGIYTVSLRVKGQIISRRFIKI